MGGQSLLSTPRYRNFIKARDKALELIQLNTQSDLSRMLSEALAQVDTLVSQLALVSQRDSLLLLTQSLELQTLEIFTRFVHPMAERIKRCKRNAYLLAHLGELEALGQATQKKTPLTQVELKNRLNQVALSQTLTGQNLNQRVWLGLMRLREKILGAFRLALVQELPPLEILQSVQNAYPKVQTFKRPPRELKPIQEADSTPKVKKEFSPDISDQEDWDSLQNDLQSESEETHSRYDWELEQEITDEFVKEVRHGQVDAANDLGIQDFVWVSVIDEKTCQHCCLPRNGMLTSEIKSALSSGDLDQDQCDAVVPPAHPNCRCSLGPVTSTDPVEGPDWKSFNDWIDSP